MNLKVVEVCMTKPHPALRFLHRFFSPTLKTRSDREIYSLKYFRRVRGDLHVNEN